MRVSSSIGLNIINNMAKSQSAMNKATQRLSTGLRVNSAADDTVAMARGQRLEAEIRGNYVATDNIQAGIERTMTADDTLSEVQSTILRMRDLAVHAANDTLTDDDRQYIQFEVEQLTQYIENLVGKSKFNQISLFSDDALSYLESTAIDVLAGNELEKLDISQQIEKLLSQDMTTDEAFDSVFATLNLLKKEKEEKGELGELTDEEKAFFDRTGINAKILGIDNFNLATLEDALNGVERMSQAAERIGSYKVDRQLIQPLDKERQQLGKEVVIQAGPYEGDIFLLNSGHTDYTNLYNLDFSTREDSAKSITKLDEVFESVAEQRAHLGAQISRMRHQLSYLEQSNIILQQTYDRIMGADIAKEMMDLTKNKFSYQLNTMLLGEVGAMMQRSVLNLFA